MGKYLKYHKIFKTSKRINLCILIFPRTHTCIFNNVIKLSQLKFAWYVHFSTWNLFYAKNSFSLFISYHSFRHHIHCFVLPICIFRNRNTFPPISSVWFIFSINLQLLILVAFHLFFTYLKNLFYFTIFIIATHFFPNKKIIFILSFLTKNRFSLNCTVFISINKVIFLCVHVCACACACMCKCYAIFSFLFFSQSQSKINLFRVGQKLTFFHIYV